VLTEPVPSGPGVTLKWSGNEIVEFVRKAVEGREAASAS
jgi:hypothetical protein